MTQEDISDLLSSVLEEHLHDRFTGEISLSVKVSEGGIVGVDTTIKKKNK